MKKYSSELINLFYTELFSTDFRDYDSATQNAKSDLIFEVSFFDEWLDGLIETFVKETNCDKSQLRADIKSCKEFVKDLRSEYEELKDLD